MLLWFMLTTSCSQSLPFEKVKHQVSTLDAQPGMTDGAIHILVTGQLLVSFINEDVYNAHWTMS